ncbi:histidine kinase [Streptomyces sp. M19]
MLAHSLSAQLVHLEAARLMIERGAERTAVLERVTAARGMAREGLSETRQALSALRGEMPDVEEFLHDAAASESARLTTEGEPRRLPAETGLAVRRVAQEALTNVRKHAPGSRVAMRLAYEETGVTLEVRDDGAGKGRLARSPRPAPGTVCSGCASAPSCSAAPWRPDRTGRASWCGCGCPREDADLAAAGPRRGRAGRGRRGRAAVPAVEDGRVSEGAV